MKHPRTKLILGPPGTGKTTDLLLQIERALVKGVRPQEICFISFTKRAANEAKERAQKKFMLGEDELKLFRTFHALAFQFMNFEPRNVMSFTNYIDICKLLNITISSQRIEEDGFQIVQTRGDRLFFLENLARSSKRTLKDVYNQYINDDLDYRELELLSVTLAKYKEIHQKIDFTDMIVQFNARGQFNKIKRFIIDEGQDLSAVQWDMAQIIANNSDEVTVAGDDDQAIYTWAGADINIFLGIKGETKVLHQSYRVPVAVFKLANSILTKIHKRNIKPYHARQEQGLVQHSNTFEHLDMSKGTWLLLARNIFLLDAYAKYCVSKGYLFTARQGSPIDPEIVEAIRHWEQLRAGKEIEGSQAKLVYKYMRTKKSVKFGCKEKLDMFPDREYIDIGTLEKDFGLETMLPWEKALTRLKEEEMGYFKAAIEHGEDINAPIRIRINTIHGVKGAEATNVVLMTDMSRKTYEEFEKHPDDEYRVWYVAVTRAMNDLHIISPTTKYFMDL